jgi:hypothetical protein
MTKGMDKMVERLARKLLPPGGRPVSVRIDDGPPRQGLLYRTDPPFPMTGCELKTPEGKTYRIEVRCIDDYALVTWG